LGQRVRGAVATSLVWLSIPAGAGTGFTIANVSDLSLALLLAPVVVAALLGLGLRVLTGRWPAAAMLLFALTLYPCMAFPHVAWALYFGLAGALMGQWVCRARTVTSRAERSPN
jgi:hypothetical protein